MSYNFPLKVKSIEFTTLPVSDSTHFKISYPNLKINEKDFIFSVDNVATYRVTEGDYITIDICDNADESSVNLFLNTYALGALLHQRALLSLHGCSFFLNGIGAVICGHSGAGKSSISYALCRSGGQFINDDITPVRMTSSQVMVIPLNEKIKLWEDTLNKLEVDFSNMEKIRPMINKFFTSVEDNLKEECELNHIIILSVSEDCKYHFEELSGLHKYNAIRRNIYRKSYLRGMPHTQEIYFSQLFSLAQKVKVTEVKRPKDSDIMECAEHIRRILF